MGWQRASPHMNMAHAHKRVVQVEKTVTVPEDRVMLELTHEEAVKLRIYSYQIQMGGIDDDGKPLSIERRKFFSALWKTLRNKELNTWDSKEFDRIMEGLLE